MIDLSTLDDNGIEMVGVAEYAEDMRVELAKHDNGRLIIRAYNEGGYNCTCVDLTQLLGWLSAAGIIPAPPSINNGTFAENEKIKGDDAE